jgi:hypothetical protein
MDAMTGEAQDLGDDIGSWLSSCANDPVRFVAEAFQWGEGELRNATGPEPWQAEILSLIKTGLMTPGQAVKIAIASGHGVGKSCLCSWITLWALSTAPDTRGIVTASSEAMLYTRFRAELRTWFRRFRAASYFEMGATSLTSADPDHSQTYRIDMVPWSATRSETLAGLHNKNRRILVIFDEASAIDSNVWETVEAVTTDADAQVVWMVCGNPLHPQGRFKDCFDRYSHRWITRHVNSLDVSFTNKVELLRWSEDYGADSDFVRTRILGRFPRVGSEMFISPEAVDRAMGRELTYSYTDPVVCGIDVARYGSDASVVYFRKGHDARTIPPQIYRGLSIAELEDRVVWLCNTYHPVQLFVDGGGVGGGLIDHLRRRNLLVIDVQFGSKADQGIDQVRYANKRAEMYGLLRRDLDYLCLPSNQELKDQLTSFEYAFNPRGEILLESKDSLRRRGIQSPDIADALATTYAAEIAMLPALSPWVQPQGAISEYNPFKIEEQDYNPFAREAPRAAFTDPETGYQFRMKSDEWSSQDHADAWASDALRYQGGSQPAPEPYSEPWPSSGAAHSLWPKLR